MLGAVLGLAVGIDESAHAIVRVTVAALRKAALDENNSSRGGQQWEQETEPRRHGAGKPETLLSCFRADGVFMAAYSKYTW